MDPLAVAAANQNDISWKIVDVGRIANKSVDHGFWNPSYDAVLQKIIFPTSA